MTENRKRTFDDCEGERDKTEVRLSRGNGDFGEAGNRLKTEVIFGQAFQLFQLFQLFQIGFQRTISLYRDSITTLYIDSYIYKKVEWNAQKINWNNWNWNAPPNSTSL